MKNIVVLIFSVLSLSCNAQKKGDAAQKQVLFIGNSLTYFHDMPQILQKMLNENQDNVQIEQSTFPGMSLSAHLSNIITSKTENGISTRIKEGVEKTETEIKIAEKNWDIIILQDGTVAVLIPENRDLIVNKAVAEIKKLVTNPNCKFLLFYTWPSKNNYPNQYCYSSNMIDASIAKEKSCSPMLLNLVQENKVIIEAYDLLAEKNNLMKAEIGQKYFEVLTKYPKINLYEDKSHPNKYGAFLSAATFYRLLTNKNSSQLKYTADIEPAAAKILKMVADQ